jgi:WD40 repeat protein
MHGARPPQRGAAASPYRGLSAFDEQDAPFFFGREAATVRVLELMAQHLHGVGLLVVSGASGAGKSSLLRAGVLACIGESGLPFVPGAASWPRLLLTPTRAPLDELALRVALLAGTDAAAVRRGLDASPRGFALTARQAALTGQKGLSDESRADGPEPGNAAGQHRRLLLIVDQFEELFTQCGDEAPRRAYITALRAAATAGPGPDQSPAALVVLGVRADYEARCADYPELVGPVQDRYLVTAMTERQLRMAITEPAKKADLRVDGDLVEVLLAEMRAGRGVFGAGMLPLLSYALDQTWRNRTSVTLTLADYERTGGIEGAVARSAQRVYDQLTAGQQAAARQVFTRLVAISSDGADTTDRTTRAELTEGKKPAQAQDVEAVLEAFAAERLLTLAADTVEISHEALLTAWPLLQDAWLAETRTDRIIRTRLRNAAAEWAAHSRDPSYLYGGSLLEAAVRAAARNSGDPGHYSPLIRAEREFLDASSRVQRRSARQRQAFFVLLLALVGFASATIVAVRSSQQVTHERDLAVSAGLISESENLGQARRRLSAQLSIAAWDIDHSSAARYAMLAAAARYPVAARTWPMSLTTSAAFSPDGKTLASGSADGTVGLWNMATGHRIRSRLTSQGGKVLSVAFSPHGETLASGGADGTIRLWDLPELTMRGGLQNKNFGAVSSVAFSPDGGTLAGAGTGGIRLWNVAITRPAVRHASNLGPVFSVAFSHDSGTVASGSTDGTIRLWDVVTGRPIVLHTGQSDGVASVAFSPYAGALASGSADGVRLWNVATGQRTGFLRIGQGGDVVSVAFSPHGDALASGSADGTIRLWDLPTHQQIGGPLGSHGDRVLSVAFSPDGRTLASASAANVRLWKVDYLVDPVDYLCHRATELTSPEWRRYLPEGPAYQETCPSPRVSASRPGSPGKPATPPVTAVRRGRPGKGRLRGVSPIRRSVSQPDRRRDSWTVLATWAPTSRHESRAHRRRHPGVPDRVPSHDDDVIDDSPV